METTPSGELWRWEIPGAPLAVELDLAVVDGICHDVIRGLGAVPRRGVEVGGILLGAVAPTDPPAVVVSGFETIQIEYRFGPQYHLSEKDVQQLRVAIARLRNNPPDSRPVGFFRSHTRGPFQLASEDLEILDEFFPGVEDIALLVRPAVLKACSATIVARHRGSFFEAPVAPEFPFRRKELAGTAGLSPHDAAGLNPARENPVAEREAPVEERHAAEPYHYPEEVMPPRFTTVTEGRSGAGWGLRLGGAALLVAVLCLGAALGNWYASDRQARAASAAPKDPMPLRLRAVREGEGVLLRWDTGSSAVTSARSGSLTIAEGNASETVELDAPQLRTGAVLYRHVAPEIRFRLELAYDGERRVSESLLWAGPQ